MRVNSIALMLALAAATSGTAEAKYLFNTKFNSGRVPAIMSVKDNDGQELSKDVYRLGSTTDGWTAVMVTGGTYAAVSPSHTRTNEPQSNLMSCPAVTITGERPMLRWKGRSIHPSFPEAYRVLLQETGKEEPEVLFEMDGEDPEWCTHALDLTPWQGKEVVISFECVSVNKFLLAIDDIYVGDPEEIEYVGRSASQEYIGLRGDHTEVTGYVDNMGMALQGGKLVCLVDGEVVDSEELPSDWLCGERFEYSFNVPVALNQQTKYSIAVEDAQGERTAVLESQVFASHFPRTLFVEEFTGFWCTNCPAGMVEFQKLQRRFGDQMIGVSVHANDVLTVTDYFEANRKYSIPWFELNRVTATEGSSTKNFEKDYLTPTLAHIYISNYTLDGERLEAEATVEWAEDVDNASDRYRVGYVLVRDVVTDEPVAEYRQTNGVTSVSGEQYYYMPGYVNSDLSPVHNVVLTSEFAHEGRPYSLPSSVKAHEPEVSAFGIIKPENLDDFKNAKLVAYVIDQMDGRILNACIQDLDKPLSISGPEADRFADGDYETEYYTLDGIKVLNPSKGIYVMRRGPKVSKVIIRD